jgi:hypothetical protein
LMLIVNVGAVEARGHGVWHRSGGWYGHGYGYRSYVYRGYGYPHYVHRGYLYRGYPFYGYGYGYGWYGYRCWVPGPYGRLVYICY